MTGWRRPGSRASGAAEQEGDAATGGKASRNILFLLIILDTFFLLFLFYLRSLFLQDESRPGSDESSRPLLTHATQVFLAVSNDIVSCRDAV